MSLLADVFVALLALLAVLGGYGALSLALLFFLEVPTHSEYPLLEDVGFPLFEDLVFVATLPFVLAVVALPAVRPVAEVADRIDAVLGRT